MSTARTGPGRAFAQGFTLIELLVVVSLLAMLLLAAAPMASDWVNNAHKREARSKLEQAYGVAKALATRNPCGIRDSSAAAALLKVTVEGTQATVTVALPGDNSSCSFLSAQANPQWTAQLASGVNVKIDEATATKDTPLTLSLNNRGITLSSSDTKTRFVLKKGDGDDEVGNLY